MNITKEEVLSKINEGNFPEWFISTQDPSNFEQNKINADIVFGIITEIGLSDSYELHRYSGSFTFLPKPVF